MAAGGLDEKMVLKRRWAVGKWRGRVVLAKGSRQKQRTARKEEEEAEEMREKDCEPQRQE
jgi:hypothetical protein